MAEYGQPLGVDDILNLSGMAQSYTNERMGRTNALRGLLKLGPVSGPQNRVGTNLRALSTATHKDIAARLTDRMLGQRLDNEDQFRGRYKLLFGEDYNEFYDEVIKNWREQVRLGISQASEKRAKAGELRAAELHPGAVTTQQQAIAKEKARIKAEDIDEGMIAVVKRAAENDIQAIRDGKKYHAVVRDRLTNKSAGWEKNHSDYYKSLMAMADQKPEATATTKAVYDTRTGQQRWMTEADIQALNKATPGTIVPTSEAPADEQQVTMGMLSAASQVLYDDAILTAAKVTADEARAILQTWASDRSWLARFNEIPENLRLLHKEWYKAYEGVMDRWYNTSTTGTVIGG